MEIIEKPWGREEVIEINERYMFKRLTMWKDHRCSLQLHNTKCETIYVLSGDLRIRYGSSQNDLDSIILSAGQYFTLAPRVVHRMEAVSDSVYLEASTPEMEDVLRLSDDYSRT